MTDIKTDCFGYEDRGTINGVPMGGRCKVLIGLYCKKEECKFYKTPEQACKECTYLNCDGCVNPYADKPKNQDF